MTARDGARPPAEAESELVRSMRRNTARLQELARQVAKTQKWAVYWRSVPEVKAVLHTVIFGPRADAEVYARRIVETCGGATEVVETSMGDQPPKTID